MGILQIITDEPGQINIPNVRRVKIISTDNLATVTAAGYLNPEVLQGYFIFNTDIIDMWYGATGNANVITNPGTYAEFTPSISNGIITLNEVVPPSGVTVTGPTPTVGHFATFSGPTSIQDGGAKGTASSKSASDVTKTIVASVNGATVVGHVAKFADVSGTIQDGGALGQAATKAVSDNTKATVASVSGTPTVGAVASFADTAGTVIDAGYTILFGTSSTFAGGGTLFSFTVTGATTASTSMVAVKNQTNTAYITSFGTVTNQIDVTFSTDPGADTRVNYIVFVPA